MNEDEYYLEVYMGQPGQPQWEIKIPLRNEPGPTPLEQAEGLGPVYLAAGATEVILVRKRPTYHRTTITA